MATETYIIPKSYTFKPHQTQFVREGYHIIGWNTLEHRWNPSPDYHIEDEIIGGFATSQDFYVCWNDQVYSVTLNTNGGTISAGKEITQYLYGLTTDLPSENDISKEHSTFGGWYDNQELTGISYAQISRNQFGDLNFYAKWIGDTFTVTFDTQGHGIQPSTQTVEYGASVQKPDDPTEEGYAFIGWFKEASCINEWNFDVDTVTQDTVLYAKWEARTYTITLELNGGILN